jgi:hypothetical protein
LNHVEIYCCNTAIFFQRQSQNFNLIASPRSAREGHQHVRDCHHCRWCLIVTSTTEKQKIYKGRAEILIDKAQAVVDS